MDDRRFDAMVQQIGAALGRPASRRARLKQAIGLAAAGTAAGAARVSAVDWTATIRGADEDPVSPVVGQPSGRLQGLRGDAGSGISVSGEGPVGGTGGRGIAAAGEGPVGGTGGQGIAALAEGPVGGAGGRGIAGPGEGPVGGTGGRGIADPSEHMLRLRGADGACNAKGGHCSGDGDCCGDLVCIHEQTNPGWISYCD